MKTVNQLSDVEIKAGIRALMQGYLNKGYRAEALHTYTNTQGEPLYWRSRLRGEDGKKIFPISFNGQAFELKEPVHDGKKPLYGLCKIKDANTAYLVEGEYKADWLNKIGIVAVATTGASSHDSLDFAPLAGKTIYLWPDNDEAGKSHIQAARVILEGSGCTTHLIDIEALGLPPKGDAYDWLKTHHAGVFEKGASQESLNQARDAVLALPLLDDGAGIGATSPAVNGGDGGQSAKIAHVKTSSFNDIKAERVDWLWHGWLPKGCLSLIAGDPKSGKSLITLYLASVVANGGLFPDGQRSEGGQNVFIWTDEDDPARVVKNRLLALTDDLTRIRAIESKYDAEGVQLPFNPSKDLDLLGTEIKRHGGAGLIILDPIYKAIDGDMNSLQDSSRSLTMLQQFAGDFNLSILGINHFRKGGSGAPQDRMIGSKAFSSVPRSIFMAKRDENVANRGMMSRIVASYAGGDGVATYETKEAITDSRDETVKVVFTGWDADKVVYDALDEATRDDESAGYGKQSSSCEDWLLDYIESVGGILESNEARSSGKDAGFSESVVKRAKEALSIQSKTSGFGKNKIGIWYLPDAKNRLDDFIYGLRKEAQNEGEGDGLINPQICRENPNKSNESHKVHSQNTGLIGLNADLLEKDGLNGSSDSNENIQGSAQNSGNLTPEELDESWERFRAEEI